MGLGQKNVPVEFFAGNTWGFEMLTTLLNDAGLIAGLLIQSWEPRIPVGRKPVEPEPSG